MRVRTLRLPVAEVDGEKNAFYADLRGSLKTCAAAANVAVRHCAIADVAAYSAVAAGSKLPKCPKLYTYLYVAGLFAGWAIVAANVARAAEGNYRRYRWEILHGRRSLPTQRSCPVPVLHNKSGKTLRLDVDDQGNVWARLRLAGGWWRVRLRGGSNYRRPLRALRLAAAGGTYGDSKVWLDRRGVAVLGVAVQMADVDAAGDGVLRVATARDALVVCVREQTETPFVIAADHVVAWQHERRRKMQRLRQDRKAGHVRRYVTAKMEQVGAGYRRRLNSYVHELTAHIVAHARRRRVAAVEFSDTVRAYCPDFPWADLREKLAYKCADVGIEYRYVGQEITAPELHDPHVYFALAVDNGRQLDKLKIGMTTGGRRLGDLERAGGQELVLLAADRQPKSKLRGRESRYHAQFAGCRLERGEWFAAGPVVEWLRATGSLGNCGNRSQIAQYLEIK